MNAAPAASPAQRRQSLKAALAGRDPSGVRLADKQRDLFVAAFRRAELRCLSQDRGARLSRATQRPEGGERFELVTWLAIAPRPARR